MPSAESRLVAGIDLGGTHIQVGLVDEAGTIVARNGVKTEADGGAAHVVEVIGRAVERTCADLKIETSTLAAAGIAAAGAMDMANGVVIVAPNLDWHNLPLRDLLAARLNLPVTLENDVNGAAWGEFRMGAGRNRGRDMLGVWVGTGVGGGLILGDRIHHGDLYTAGEIGHIVARPNAPAGARTVEDLCSRTGMRRQLVAAIAGDDERARACPLRTVALENPASIGTTELHAAWQSGDPLTAAIIEEAADLLGTVIAGQVTMLAVSAVLIGGGITEVFGPPWVDRIRRSYEADVFPASAALNCSLHVTELAADAGLLGAALLARESL